MPEAEGTMHRQVHCLWLPGDYLVLRDPGALAHPEWHSHAWFCPLCGEIWMREVIEGGDSWDVILASCGCRPSHYNNEIEGSITMPTRYPMETFDTLPPELALRETHILLEHSYHGIPSDSTRQHQQRDLQTLLRFPGVPTGSV